MPRKLPAYLGILVGLLALTAALFFWLRSTGQPALANTLLIVGNTLASAWVLRGLFLWRHVGWVAWATRLLVLTLGAQLLASAAFALNLTGAGNLIVGAWAMGIAFYLGLTLLRLLFTPGHPVLGVARTMLDEAIRQKVGLIFVVILVVMVPLLPLILADNRLEYRVSNFLRYSLFVTGLLLSVMTILLCARSVSRECESNIIYVTLTKPLARWQYLLGKWVGVMGLNAVLLLVAGVGVYTLTQTIAQQPAQDSFDALAVKHQVLTARLEVRPSEIDQGELGRRLAENLDRLRLRDPDTYNTTDPFTGQARPIPFDDLPQNIRTQLQSDLIVRWLAIPERNSAIYRFAGLQDARNFGQFVQLRFKPKAAGAAPPDKKLQLFFRVNGRELPFLSEDDQGQIVAGPMPRIPEERFAMIRVPVDSINDDGTLDIEIFNGGRGAPPQPTISFNPADGLQVLYQVGGFGPNLAKALVMLWVRLMFLAMLGIAAATFLGFPTACLLCGLVFVASTWSGYLDESLGQYGAFPQDSLPWWQQLLGVPAAFFAKLSEGEYYDAFKVIIRTIGEVFALLVPSLGDYNPGPMIAQGKAITLPLLGQALLWVGGVWTAALAAIAAFMFHRRELAEVTV